MDEKIEYNPSWGICKPIRNNEEFEIAKIICKKTHKTELKHCEMQCNVDCINYGKAIKEAGYRKESDTAKEICELILEHWEKKQFVECDWLRVAIAEKYGVDLGE